MVPECGGGRKIGWGCETQQKDHRKKKKMWTLESLNLESESPGNDGGRAALPFRWGTECPGSTRSQDLDRQMPSGAL